MFFTTARLTFAALITCALGSQIVTHPLAKRKPLFIALTERILKSLFDKMTKCNQITLSPFFENTGKTVNKLASYILINYSLFFGLLRSRKIHLVTQMISQVSGTVKFKDSLKIHGYFLWIAGI